MKNTIPHKAVAFTLAALATTVAAPAANAVDMPSVPHYNAANPITNNHTVRTEAILHYTNAIRMANGLSPVAKNPALDGVAQDWANHLVRVGELNHRPKHWEAYPDFVPAGGENVLQAWDDYSSYELVKLWFDSPGHRKILLDPSAKSLGVGVAVGSDGKLFAVQNFGR